MDPVVGLSGGLGRRIGDTVLHGRPSASAGEMSPGRLAYDGRS
jgi:hypothetical protein